MSECRQLICTEPAEFEVTVRYFGGVRERKALYCTEHLARVQEALAKRETSEITNIRPIEKGPIMQIGTTLRYTPVEGLTLAAEPGALATVITYAEAMSLGVSRVSLEASKEEGQVLLRWEEGPLRHGQSHGTYPIHGFVEVDTTLSTANERINGLEHDNSQLKSTNIRLNDEIETFRQKVDALVKALHEYANDQEGHGDNNTAEEIDGILSEHGLPARKKHFEMIFTVPVQIRVEGDYRDANDMRQAYAVGEINWDVADYDEVLDDDVKIISINEVEQ